MTILYLAESGAPRLPPPGNSKVHKVMIHRSLGMLTSRWLWRLHKDNYDQSVECSDYLSSFPSYRLQISQLPWIATKNVLCIFRMWLQLIYLQKINGFYGLRKYWWSKPFADTDSTVDVRAAKSGWYIILPIHITSENLEFWYHQLQYCRVLVNIFWSHQAEVFPVFGRSLQHLCLVQNA